MIGTIIGTYGLTGMQQAVEAYGKKRAGKSDALEDTFSETLQDAEIKSERGSVMADYYAKSPPKYCYSLQTS